MTNLCSRCDDQRLQSSVRGDCLFAGISEAVSLVAGLGANSSIPYGIVPQIAQSFNSMADSMMSLVQVEVASSLCDAVAVVFNMHALHIPETSLDGRSCL